MVISIREVLKAFPALLHDRRDLDERATLVSFHHALHASAATVFPELRLEKGTWIESDHSWHTRATNFHSPGKGANVFFHFGYAVVELAHAGDDRTSLLEDCANIQAKFAGKDEFDRNQLADLWRDVERFDKLSGEQGFHQPIFPDLYPQTRPRVAALLVALRADRAKWDFWARWYEGMLKGEPLDWQLQKAVAEIESDVWDEGAQAVAEEITRIERLHKTNVAPSLVLAGDDFWDVENSPTIPKEPLEFAIHSVEQSLDSALKLCSANMFNEESDEAVIIMGALDRYGENPSLLAVTFWQACMSFQANLDSEYPKDDAHLVGLQNTLYTSIEEMCEHSEIIQKRIGRLAALQPKRDLTNRDQADLAELPNETKEHLTEQAQEELVEAVDGVRGARHPARSLQARLANWVTTLGKGLDEGQKHDKRAKWLLDLGRRLMRVFFPGGGEDD